MSPSVAALHHKVVLDNCDGNSAISTSMADSLHVTSFPSLMQVQDQKQRERIFRLNYDVNDAIFKPI